jgi:hypothetical protein
MHCTEADKDCLPVPLYHCFGLDRDDSVTDRLSP